jgi:polygalacturonase
MINNLNKIKEIKDGQNIKFSIKNPIVLPSFTDEEYIYVSNNDSSLKKIFVNLKNRKNIVLDFCGHTLEFNGRITPFYIDGCKNVTVKNLNIKFSNHYYFQALIKKIDGKKIFIEPTTDDNFMVENGRIILDYGDEKLDYGNKTVFIQEFETNPVRVAKKSGIRITTLGGGLGKAETYSFSDDKKYIECSINPPFTEGNTLCFFCENRISDAFVINKSQNVKLQNINIYNSPAMGVVCQVSKNIFLDNVNVVRDKKDKHIITSLADATHFTNCAGKVVIKNCTFENMNDDGTNIHGMYTVVKDVLDKSVDVEFKHFQQFGIDIYRAFDKVVFLDKESKTAKCSGKIIAVKNISDCVTRLTFNEQINVSVGDVLENPTLSPKVRIINCKTGGNRPRGFLIATNKKAVVENCEFYNSECGVGVFADTDFWFEAGAVSDITVKNCIFSSNYGGESSAISVKPSVKKGQNFFNGKITVKNCKFNCDYGDAVNAFNTEKVVLKNNVALVSGNPVEFLDKVKLTDCGN